MFTFTLRRAAMTSYSRRVVGPDKAPKLRWRVDVRECFTPPLAGHIYRVLAPETSLGFGTVPRNDDNGSARNGFKNIV